MDLHPDFRDLLSALADTNAEYLVVGGWAVGFHAEPRFTKDLDLFIGPSDANLAAVVAGLARSVRPRISWTRFAHSGPRSSSSSVHRRSASTSCGR